MSNYSEWYNAQTSCTKAWLDKQAIWKDSDMIKAFLVGCAVGLAFGIVVGIYLGTPDISGLAQGYLKG